MPAAALPCVVVGAAALCEQVPNGRSINYNCTACQPTLGKKPIKDWEKPLTLWKKQSTWISCHADGWKEHRAARWIGFAEPATPWQCLSELRLLIWLKRWIKG